MKKRLSLQTRPPLNHLLLLLLVVIWTGLVHTTTKEPQEEPPCSTSLKYAAWMGELGNTHRFPDSTFPQRRLNEILIAGTHDAGMWTVELKGLASFLPPSYFQTQQGDILYQLCMGNRWFDLRIEYVDQTFKLFHGSSPIIAYGGTLDSVIQSAKDFLSYPKYNKEIVFWRIKVGPSVSSEDLAEILRTELAPFIVDKVDEDVKLQGMRVMDIWNQSLSGHLILMNYGWTPPAVEIGQRQGWFWDYPTAQLGEYSDALTLPEMLNRCLEGQVPRLLKYKSLIASFNNSDYPLIGIWWTFTTGDIKQNTHTQMTTYPTSLYDFYLTAKAEIGNVLIVDFIDFYEKDLMTIVWRYNYNKYAVYPPLPPTTGIPQNTSSPIFPGQVFKGEPCDNIGSATEAFITAVLAVFIMIVLFLFGTVLFILIICCLRCRKKKRRDSDNSLQVIME